MDGLAHVLIVDDEADFVAMMRVLLEREHYRVSGCASAPAAVRRVCDGLAPDIVLLDFQMPVLDGGDTLRQMRRCGLSSPAILVSGTPDIREQALANGFAAWVPKPFDFATLLGAIGRCLTRP
jgi:CheY-like chemotaxis protein